MKPNIALRLVACILIFMMAHGRSETVSGESDPNRVSFTFLNQPAFVAYAPVGTMLAIGGYSFLRLYDERLTLLNEMKNVSAVRLTWSPDGARLASINAVESVITIVIYKVPTLDIETTIQVTRPGSAFTTLAWSPDGNSLAAIEYDDTKSFADGGGGSIIIWNTRTWQAMIAVKRFLGCGYPDTLQIAWSPDSTSMAYFGMLNLADRKTGYAVVELATGNTQGVDTVYCPVGLVWSPLEDLIVNTALNVIRDNDAGHRYNIDVFGTVSNDGEWVAGRNETQIIIFDFYTRLKYEKGNFEDIEVITWRADGRYIAVLERGNYDKGVVPSVKLLDVSGLRHIRWLPEREKLTGATN